MMRKRHEKKHLQKVSGVHLRTPSSKQEWQKLRLGSVLFLFDDEFFLHVPVRSGKNRVVQHIPSFALEKFRLSF